MQSMWNHVFGVTAGFKLFISSSNTKLSKLMNMDFHLKFTSFEALGIQPTSVKISAAAPPKKSSPCS